MKNAFSKSIEFLYQRIGKFLRDRDES